MRANDAVDNMKMSLVAFGRAVLAAVCLAWPLGVAGAVPAHRAVEGQRLKIGIVQMARAPDFQGTCERIIAGIAAVAGLGARVAVFPEGALNNVQGDEPKSALDDALAAIRRTARENDIYVVLAGADRRASAKAGDKTYVGNQTNWMMVIGPDGRDLFRYEKLYDNSRGKMPGVFEIDGFPAAR